MNSVIVFKQIYVYSEWLRWTDNIFRHHVHLNRKYSAGVVKSHGISHSFFKSEKAHEKRICAIIPQIDINHSVTQVNQWDSACCQSIL